MKLRTPRVGAVPQEGPDRLRLAQTHQGHRGPRLSLGQPVLGLGRDQRPVPDRGRQRRALGRRADDRPGDGAVAQGGQLPAAPQVLGGVEGVEGRRLEPRLGRPDAGEPPFGVSGFEEPGERRVVPERVEIGGVVEQGEAQVVVADPFLKQGEGPPGQGACLRVVGPVDGLRGDREGAGGVVTQVGVPRLLPERGFQGLDRGVGPVAEFRRDDGRQGEPGPFRRVLLITGQVGEGGFLLAKPRLRDRPEFERVEVVLALGKDSVEGDEGLVVFPEPQPGPGAVHEGARSSGLVLRVFSARFSASRARSGTDSRLPASPTATSTSTRSLNRAWFSA